MNTLSDTFGWFVKARPEPTDKDFHSQVGCHLEEVVEMLEKLSSDDNETHGLIVDAIASLHDLGEHLKKNDDVVFVKASDEEDFLDSICDQIVTATGVAYIRDYALIGAMDAVNKSNYSKFDEKGNPIFNLLS